MLHALAALIVAAPLPPALPDAEVAAWETEIASLLLSKPCRLDVETYEKIAAVVRRHAREDRLPKTIQAKALFVYARSLHRAYRLSPAAAAYGRLLENFESSPDRAAAIDGLLGVAAEWSGDTHRDICHEWRLEQGARWFTLRAICRLPDHLSNPMRCARRGLVWSARDQGGERAGAAAELVWRLVALKLWGSGERGRVASSGCSNSRRWRSSWSDSSARSTAMRPACSRRRTSPSATAGRPSGSSGGRSSCSA